MKKFTLQRVKVWQKIAELEISNNDYINLTTSCNKIINTWLSDMTYGKITSIACIEKEYGGFRAELAADADLNLLKLEVFQCKLGASFEIIEVCGQ